MWKKCKVIRLQNTNERRIGDLLLITPTYLTTINNHSDIYACKHFPGIYQPQHLYILSDDEIKEGDKVYFPKDNVISKYGNGNYIDRYKSDLKKIIASADPSLNLPRPSDDFIKEYCHKGGIDEVMVEHIFACEECGKIWIDKPLECKTKIKNPLYTHDRICCSKTFVPRLKVNPDNTVNIKNIKDSWNRKEIENFILQKLDIFYMNVESKNHRLPLEEEIKDFLRENL